MTAVVRDCKIHVMLWLLLGFAALGSGCALSFALRLMRTFRSSEDPADTRERHESLSVLVPIKGADERTPEVLRKLVSSTLPGEVEYVFAVESEEDPAFAVCEHTRRTHPGRNISIVLSGAPRGLNGKQHNLAHAFRHSTGEVVACMDADVEVEPDTLRAGLPYLESEDAGSAFFLPAYRGEAPLGGRLVEIYLNYHYNLYMGALATLSNPPFVFGGLWMTRRSSLARTAGFGSFGLTVSDDVAIGRAFRDLGLRNLLIPRTVAMQNESLDAIGGLTHLGKWIGMLRAEGVVPYLAVWLWWYPLFWSAALLALGMGMGWLDSASLLFGAVGVGLCLAAKLTTGVILNVGVYRQPLSRSLLGLLAYEVLVVPLVFGVGLVRRSIRWKGRRYRLGPGGTVLGDEDVT